MDETHDADPVIQDAGEFEVDSEEEYGADTHRSKRRRPDEDADEEDRDAFIHNMHPRDPAHFFKLTAALRILFARKITDEEIDKADTLLREYSLELIEV